MKKALSVGLIMFTLLTACGTGATATPTPVPPTAAPPTALPPTALPSTPTATPTPAAATPANPSDCKNAAAFVADVTVPDYAHFEPREAFTKTWRVKNVGTCSWTPDYTAMYSHGDVLGPTSAIPLAATAPGATLDISIPMAAPARDGTYKVYYQLRNAAGQAMPVDDGASMWAIITVGKVIVAVPPTAAPAPTGSSGSTGTTGPGCSAKSNVDFISQTLTLINAARAANSLPALTINAKLNAAAQAHSVDMACSGSLSHTGSDGSTPASRIAGAGYSASITRENIYAQPPQYGGNPQSAMDWWMNSQLHRDAILNAQVKEIGIGYAAYSASPLGGYFTVDFAAP